MFLASTLCFLRASNYFFAGKTKEEAMNDYITKVKQLLEEAGMPA